MSSLNKVTLIGRIGRDPEVRSTNNGSKVASFSLATSEKWRDKRSGETVEKTEWHNIVVWSEGTVGFIEKYCNKGDLVYVEGKLETRTYQDKDGNERRTTEIVLKPFNGQLTMLAQKDGGGGGRGRGDDDDDRGGRNRGRDDRDNRRDDRDRDEGRSSNRRTSQAIDDDIPF